MNYSFFLGNILCENLSESGLCYFIFLFILRYIIGAAGRGDEKRYILVFFLVFVITLDILLWMYKYIFGNLSRYDVFVYLSF